MLFHVFRLPNSDIDCEELSEDFRHVRLTQDGKTMTVDREELIELAGELIKTRKERVL